MKVKKKYIIIGTILLFFSLLITYAVNEILTKYNLKFNDGELFLKSGFSTEPASNLEIREYLSETQKNIDVLNYNLSIDLFAENEILDGNAIITARPANDKISNIELNFREGFEIKQVLLNEEKIEYNYSDDKIKLYSNEVIIDTFKVQISYRGTPENLGFGSFSFGNYNGESVVYTISEPIFASTWFPCNDTPKDKVLMDIFITNDSNKTSISNGILVGTEIKNDRKTFHWKTEYPISTYLISFFSGNYYQFNDSYISINNDTMRVEYFVFKDKIEQAKKDFKIHNNAIKHFEELFGEYPFIKEKYGVAQFLWSLGAMENQTITGIGSNFISGNNFFTGMLVHELAHQWWGNAVTLTDWKNIWLNEGFATYSEALYWEKETGSSSLRSTMAGFLTDFENTTLYNPEKLFSRVTYNKGAWVLHMLRKEIGDENFFNLLKKYFEKYKYNNASTEQFIELAEKISKKSLNKFFDQWVYNGKGKLEINYTYNQQKSDSTFVIDLEINQTQNGYENYEFLLDLEFYLDHYEKVRKTIKIKKKQSKFTFEFPAKITKIDLDPDTWLAAEIKFVE